MSKITTIEYLSMYPKKIKKFKCIKILNNGYCNLENINKNDLYDTGSYQDVFNQIKINDILICDWTNGYATQIWVNGEKLPDKL